MKVKYSKKPYIKYILLTFAALCVMFLLIGLLKDDKLDMENNEWVEVSHKDEVPNYKYDFVLDIDTENKTMDGKLDFTYVNNNDEDMDILVFYLYANSFKYQDYYAIAQDDYYDAYPNGFSKGSIDINSLSIEGGGSFEVKGEQEHILEITLDNPVKKGDTVDINMEYVVTVPNSLGRFGYGENTMSLVNCNPIMAVYDEGYYSYEYNNVGDPFYSESADYTAKITIDDSYLIAATGDIANETIADGKRTVDIDGKDIRDFGLVVSDDFEVATETINGVEVNSFGFSSQRMTEKALDAGVKAIDAYSKLYGEYPYDTFNVVESDFYIGGMEYPGMVLIDTSYYDALNQNVMEMIIAHEAGHQWWYAQIGSDQVAKPWLDESLTEFSTRMYYRVNYPDIADAKIAEVIDRNYEYLNNYMDKKEVNINSQTLMYEDSWEYSLVVYGRGMMMFDDLRVEMGDEAFFVGLQEYLEDNRFEIVDEQDLYDAMQNHTDIDIEKWFDNNFTVEIG